MGNKKKSSYWRKRCVKKSKDEAKRLANYTCERCGRTRPYTMHGSHILPEGAHVSMSADVDNILCLCFRCHFYWWHKNPLDAAAWFDKKWPERKKELLKRARVMRVVNWEKKWKDISNPT